MNSLQTEKSPYLLQHVNNPVDWYPWGESAFERARAENKLIFLSIGYSTCHWCHVMAHESFEDDEVAKLLNGNYISVKVDREERPDIDQVYMEVCQRLTGSGGWPLSIIMTPDALPFYAATYIPKHGRQGRPGMMNLLPWVTDKWQEDPGFLSNAAQEVVEEMRGRGEARGDLEISADLHMKAEHGLKNSFDQRHGGFGQAPKFPRPHDLTFLLQQYGISGDEKCLEMAEQTLVAMRSGGIYDQLGFGFHRYATDEKWLVPHIEKMLYDQAGLVLAYLDAWQITGREIYARTAHEVISYLLRDMLASKGAFFSAEDADSEGVEGKFYLWSQARLTELLASDVEDFCKVYNVTTEGNYHDEVTGKVTGSNILHLSAISAESLVESAKDERFAACRKILFAERETRVRPHLDDKIIAAWNGMAISALSEAGRVFEEQSYLERAHIAADFVLTAMRDKEGRLYRRYRQGEAAVAAFSEDYAFLARGLLDLYAADYDVRRLAQAIDLAKTLRQFFQDSGSGRLYDTPSDGEKLLIRPWSTFDGAMPSASSITLDVFARLFLLTGDSAWQASAEQLFHSLAIELSRYPAGYTQFLQSANMLMQTTREVVIVGVPGDPSTEAMLSVTRKANRHQVVVLFKCDENAEQLAGLSPFTELMALEHDRATAYVCQDFTCGLPVADAQELHVVLTSRVV